MAETYQRFELAVVIPHLVETVDENFSNYREWQIASLVYVLRDIADKIEETKGTGYLDSPEFHGSAEGNNCLIINRFTVKVTPSFIE